MEDGLLWLGVIVVLILIAIICFRIYKRSTASPDCRYSGGLDYGDNYVMVVYGGRPTVASREWFTSEMGDIKTDIISILANLSSMGCKDEVVPLLTDLKRELAYQVQNMGSDKQFCAMVNDYITQKGPAYDAWQQMKEQVRGGKGLVQMLSRSDKDLDIGISSIFDDILVQLDGIINTIATKICTVDGRANLDYIYAVIDKLGEMCDYSRQSGLVKPVVDAAYAVTLQPWVDAPADPNYKVPPADPFLTGGGGDRYSRIGNVFANLPFGQQSPPPVMLYPVDGGVIDGGVINNGPISTIGLPPQPQTIQYVDGPLNMGEYGPNVTIGQPPQPQPIQYVDGGMIDVGNYPPLMFGPVALSSKQIMVQAEQPVQVSQVESFENRPRGNKPGAGVKPRRIGNSVNEAEFAVRVPMRLPSIPPMMKQISLDREYHKPYSTLSERTNSGKRSVNRAARTGPKSVIGLTTGSKA